MAKIPHTIVGYQQANPLELEENLRYLIAFQQSFSNKNLDCIGALSFYDSKWSFGGESFLSIFWTAFKTVKSLLHVKTKSLGQTAELIEEQREY